MRRERGTGTLAAGATQIGLIIVLAIALGVTAMMMLAMISVGSSGPLWRSLLSMLATPKAVLYFLIMGLAAAALIIITRKLSSRQEGQRSLLPSLAISLWMLSGVAVAFILWGFRAMALAPYFWSALLLLGVSLIGHGFTRRIGGALHCANCGYPYDADHGPRCPECGSVLAGRVGTTRGRPARSPAAIVAGILVLLIAGTLATRLFAAGAINQWVPTRVLISQIDHARFWPSADWSELVGRTLRPKEEARLAEALLNFRARSNRLDSGPAKWLADRFAKAALPAALENRYYLEMIELKLKALEDDDGGGGIVQAIAINRTTPFGPTEERIIFGGFRVNGQLVPGTRLERSTSVYQFDPWSVSRKPGQELPSVRVGPGSVVEAEAWICYGGKGMLAWGNAWNADGTPMLPAADRIEHVELRLEVPAE